MQFHIDDMTCGGCARTVMKTIESIDPSATVTADPSSRLVKIETSAAQDKIVSALRGAGFPPRK